MADLPALARAPFTGGPRRSAASRRFRVSSSRAGYWFVLPAAVIMAGLIIYPMINGFVLSLFNTNLVNKWQFVGPKYFIQVLTNPDFLTKLGITAEYALLVVAGNLVIGLGLALLLNRPMRFRTLFRAILILPWLFPEAVVALIWKWLMNPLYGPVNGVLQAVGIIHEPVDWLGTPQGAFATIVFASIWKGYPLVLIMMLAGLQTIPKDLYEAAELDGAGPVNSFLSVTLPGLRPILVIVIILETVWWFKNFTIAYLLTAGGPVGSTSIVSVEIYNTAFQNFQFGRAAAMAVIVFFVCLLISLVYRRLIKDDLSK